MAESKTTKEIVADITIAWIKAKSDNTVSGTGKNSDRGIPSAEEVTDFYKTVYGAVVDPKQE